jgi:hypothetical protein
VAVGIDFDFWLGCQSFDGRLLWARYNSDSVRRKAGQRQVAADFRRKTPGTALPKKSPALPADVRKAFGLPETLTFDLGYAHLVGQSPKINCDPERKRLALPHIRRQAAGVNHFLAKAVGNKF